MLIRIYRETRETPAEYRRTKIVFCHICDAEIDKDDEVCSRASDCVVEHYFCVDCCRPNGEPKLGCTVCEGEVVSHYIRDEYTYNEDVAIVDDRAIHYTCAGYALCGNRGEL